MASRQTPWHEAVPSDATLKGNWWELFADPALDPLVERALQANQNLRVAAARLDQARSQVTMARSYLYPEIGVQASAARSKISANRPLAPMALPYNRRCRTISRWAPSVNYELDLFGRVRRASGRRIGPPRNRRRRISRTRV